MSARDEFLTVLATLRQSCAELEALIDDHMGVDPDAVSWPHVGDANRLLAALDEALAPHLDITERAR